MAALAAEQQQRADEPGAATPETYLLIHGLQRNKKLRFDEEMSFSLDAGAGGNPGLQLNKLICEGAEPRLPRHRQLRHLQQCDAIPQPQGAE